MMLLPTSFVLLALSLAPSAFADAPANNKTTSGGPIRIDHLPIGFGPGPVIVPSSNCSAAISNLSKNHELNECLGLTRDKYSALNATLGEPGQSIAYQFGDYLGQTLCPAQACRQEALDAAVAQVKGNCSDQLINTSPTKSVVPATEATFISLFLSSCPLQRNISCLANVLTGPPKEHPTAEIQGNGICFVELMKNIEAHTDVVFDSPTLIKLKGNDATLMKEIQDKLAKNGSDVAKKTFCTDCHKTAINYLFDFSGKLNAHITDGSHTQDQPPTSESQRAKAAPHIKEYLTNLCGASFLDGEMPKSVELRTGYATTNGSVPIAPNAGPGSVKSNAARRTIAGPGAGLGVGANARLDVAAAVGIAVMIGALMVDLDVNVEADVDLGLGLGGLGGDLAGLEGQQQEL